MKQSHLVSLPPDERATVGDLLFDEAGRPFRVAEVVDDLSVRVRPERWYEAMRDWLREYVGRDRDRLPFPHVVVGDRLKVRPEPGHGGDIGDVIRMRCGHWRWRTFRIVQVLPDDCLLIRPPRWYDRLANAIARAGNARRGSSSAT